MYTDICGKNKINKPGPYIDTAQHTSINKETPIPEIPNIATFRGLIDQILENISIAIEDQKVAIQSLEETLSKILTPEEYHFKINENIYNQEKGVADSIENYSITSKLLKEAYLKLTTNTRYIKIIIDRIEL
jgi:rRNA pseudouridine-1189 N-methylase Emg1 (Nep1/Mra1 family)